MAKGEQSYSYVDDLMVAVMKAEVVHFSYLIDVQPKSEYIRGQIQAYKNSGHYQQHMGDFTLTVGTGSMRERTTDVTVAGSARIIMSTIW